MKHLLPLLILMTAAAQAQSLSGPSESRAPRSQENESINRAVCATKVPLGKLSGCKLKLWADASASQVVGPGGGFMLSSIFPGSFTAPRRQEMLATYCIEGEGCAGETALLRRVAGRWNAVQNVPNFLPSHCLSYPKPDGTQAAVCLGESSRTLGNTLQVALWTAGKLRVSTVALFPYLNFADPKSQQCLGGWQYAPFSWSDHDRNADGVPDLTVLATLNTYKPAPDLCSAGQAVDSQPSTAVRRDLTFVWTGEALRPTGTTADIINRYARGQ